MQAWERFTVTVQTDPGPQSASSKIGTGSFPGVKEAGCSIKHPIPSSTEVKGAVQINLSSPSVLSWPILG